MQTVGTLHAAVMRFVNNNSAISDVLQGEMSGEAMETLLLAASMTAMNNARLFAERRHDFSKNDVCGKVVIPAAGVASLERVVVGQYGALDDKTSVLYNVGNYQTGTMGSLPMLRVNLSSDVGDWDIPLEKIWALEVKAPVEVSSWPVGVRLAVMSAEKFAEVVGDPEDEVFDYFYTFKLSPHLNMVAGENGIFDVVGAWGIDDEVVRLKSLRNASIVASDGMSARPVRIQTGQSNFVEMLKQGERHKGRWTGTRLLVSNQMVGLFPSGSEEMLVELQGNRWMDEYTSMDQTDWMIRDGFDYMLWASICELNYIIVKYIPRLEGTIAPPEKARDMAFETLMVNDAYSVEGTTYPEGD